MGEPILRSSEGLCQPSYVLKQHSSEYVARRLRVPSIAQEAMLVEMAEGTGRVDVFIIS